MTRATRRSAPSRSRFWDVAGGAVATGTPMCRCSWAVRPLKILEVRCLKAVAHLPRKPLVRYHTPG